MKLNDEGLTSETINEIAVALSKAQAQVEAAVEDKINPHFKSSYSSLYSTWCACREALTQHGLSVTQPTSIENDVVMLHTILMHSSGQWVRGKIPVTSAKMTPQGVGSGMTYMRRYALCAVVGVAPGEDDDGNAAEDKTPSREFKTVKLQAPVKDEGFDEFVKKLELNLGERKEYVRTIAKNLKKSEIEVINTAMKREDRFIESCDKWIAEREAKNAETV